MPKNVVGFPGELYFTHIEGQELNEVVHVPHVEHLFFDDSNLRCHIKAGHINRWIYFEVDNAIEQRHPYYYPELRFDKDGVFRLTFAYEQGKLTFLSGEDRVRFIPGVFHQYI